MLRTLGSILLALLLLGCQTTRQVTARDSSPAFEDNLGDPTKEVVTGEKAAEVKRCLDILFEATYASRREEYENRLVALVSPYEEPYDFPGVTWSAPMKFRPAPHRAFAVALFHGGTGHYVDVWVVREETTSAEVFRFEGSEKGCGHWQWLNDLDDDGTLEIVVKNFVGSYDGAYTRAVWAGVYRWDGANYIRDDERFPEFYAQQTSEYEKILAKHEAWQDSDSELKRAVYRKLQHVLDKAREIAGQDD